MRWRLPAAIFALVLLALPQTACITREVKTTISDRDGVEVFLRGRKRGRTPIERDFQHPTIISAERLARMLAAIDVELGEDKGKKRAQKGAFVPEMILPIAAGLSEALERANSTQEVAVLAVYKKRKLGLFHEKFLTSFVAWAQADHLFVFFARIDWPVPKNREDKLPEPRLGDRVMAFETVPTIGIQTAGAQTVAIRWRDPMFDTSHPLSLSRGDQRRKRTILMDSPIPPEERGPADLPDSLSPETLRALADLEESRQRGEITEIEYQQKRDALLSGG